MNSFGVLNIFTFQGKGKRIRKQLSSFEELYNIIIKSFPILKDKEFEIDYRDSEGEQIIVTDDADLEEAYIQLQEGGLTVSQVNGLTIKFQITMKGQESADPEKKEESHPKKLSIENEEVVNLQKEEIVSENIDIPCEESIEPPKIVASCKENPNKEIEDHQKGDLSTIEKESNNIESIATILAKQELNKLANDIYNQVINDHKNSPKNNQNFQDRSKIIEYSIRDNPLQIQQKGGKINHQYQPNTYKQNQSYLKNPNCKAQYNTQNNK